LPLSDITAHCASRENGGLFIIDLFTFFSPSTEASKRKAFFTTLEFWSFIGKHSKMYCDYGGYLEMMKR
jgi:hypothetical protein